MSCQASPAPTTWRSLSSLSPWSSSIPNAREGGADDAAARDAPYVARAGGVAAVNVAAASAPPPRASRRSAPARETEAAAAARRLAAGAGDDAEGWRAIGDASISSAPLAVVAAKREPVPLDTRIGG